MVVEPAEEAVVVPLGSIDAEFEPALHGAMHGFPITAAGEPDRWCSRNRDEAGADLGAYQLRAILDEVAPGNGLVRIVDAVSFEVDDLVRIVR